MILLVATCTAVVAYLVVSRLIPGGHTAERATRPARRRTPRRASLQVRLRQAGIPMTPTRYRATIAASALITIVVVWALTATLALALAAAIAVTWAPRMFYRRRRDRQLTERIAAWPEAIRDVLSALAVDATLPNALAQLGRNGPVPLRDVWIRYGRNASLMSSAAALELVRDELADPVSDYVIEAFIAALERGQAIAVDVLRSLADNVAADVQLRAEIMTSQADIRSQAIMIVVIPFAVLAYLVSRNSDYAEFYRRTVGFVVVAFGAGLATLGWRLMSRLGRIPDQPRTFGGGR